jgi:putative FmdB family regulatory protein
MPTYEYECASCGHGFEQFQNMSDEPLKTCPECGGEVKRLIGAGSGIIFKGPGFYSTDYGNSSVARGAGLGANCDRTRPCCGRDAPCERSPRRT